MKTKNLPLYIIAGIIIIGVFTLIGFLIYKPIPEINRDVLNLTIGALLVAFASVINYWFGSSKGSSDKTDLLSKAQPIQDI
jgi:hypothetical protein